MRQTKKVTLSAMCVALSAVVLLLGSFIGIMELTIGAVASLLVVFVMIEVKGAYPWLVWAATSLIALLLFPSKTIGFSYLVVFGIYPILKAYIERLPKILWWIIKIVYINVILVITVFLSEFITGVPFFEELVAWYLKVALIFLFNVSFVAYDLFLTVMVRLYFLKFREKFKRFLK